MVFKYTKQVIMGEELRRVIKQENIPLLQNQYSALRDSLSFNAGLLLTVMTPFFMTMLGDKIKQALSRGTTLQCGENLPVVEDRKVQMAHCKWI